MFHRLLRATIDVTEYLEHLSALAGSEAALAAGLLALDGSVPVATLVERLEALEEGYAALIERIADPGEGPSGARDLGRFADCVFEHYGSRRRAFRMILILDQFEEIFTRFQAPGPQDRRSRGVNQLDWKLRLGFFEALEALYRRARPTDVTAGQGEDRAALPLRFVIGIREDYLGHLDPLRRFIPGLDESAFRLNLLTRDQAADALQQPAKLYGFRYSQDCADLILKEVSSEEGFVEPGILQMVCSRLWMEKGRTLAQPRAATDELPEIGAEIYRDTVKGVDGIVDAFVEEVLTFEASDGSSDPVKDRREALEILQSLITSDRTRDILATNRIVEAPFRFGEQRARLLEHLERRGIVRVESRGNRRFVEITHELLIDAIFKAYRDEATRTAEYLRLYRGALPALARAAQEKPAARAAELVSPAEFRAAHELREEINFGWKDPATGERRGYEIMFRCGLKHGGDVDTLAFWAQGLDCGEDVGDRMTIHDWSERPEPLAQGPWRLLGYEPESRPLTAGQVETVFRSAIQHARETDRQQVVHWAKRCLASDQSA